MTEAPSTRIAIFSEEELQKYGYRPVTHPDGYVYFEKENNTSSIISSTPEVDAVTQVKTEIVDTSFESKNVDSLINDSFCKDRPTSSVDLVVFKNKEGVSNETSLLIEHDEHNVDPVHENPGIIAPNQTETINIQPESVTPNDNLKLKYAEEIGRNGFIKCPFSTCNFISLSVSAMVRHSSKCNGLPLFHTNLCTLCDSWLVSSMQRDIHAGKCQGYKFGVYKNSTASSSTGPNTATAASPTPALRKYAKATKKVSSRTDNIDIIQPRLKHPVGSYLRKRSYTPVHLDIWTKKFEESKYIPCHFRGCRFIAMSLGDMRHHFAYCTGNSSFAKFKCPHCCGEVTSQSLLDTHIVNSHSQGEAIGREEEYPSEEKVDTITESLEQLCDEPDFNDRPYGLKREGNVLLVQSSTDSFIDHSYTYSSVSSPGTNDSNNSDIKNVEPLIKLADEMELIEMYETTFSLEEKTNKSKFASISTSQALPLQSASNVKQTAVMIGVSKSLKNSNLNFDKAVVNSILSNTSPIKLNNDDSKNCNSNMSANMENGITSLSVSNNSLTRRTVITDGRLINRNYSVDDKVNDELLDGSQNDNILNSTSETGSSDRNKQEFYNNYQKTINNVDNIVNVPSNFTDAENEAQKKDMANTAKNCDSNSDEVSGRNIKKFIDLTEIPKQNVGNIVNSSFENLNMNVDNSTQDANINASLDCEPPKRKRGRPKKVKPEETEEMRSTANTNDMDETTSIVNPLKKKSGRRRSSENEDIVENNLPRHARKRRLIYRLSSTDDSNSSDSEKEIKMKTRDPPIEAGESATPSKRKVGRPRKSDIIKPKSAEMTLSSFTVTEDGRNESINDLSNDNDCDGKNAIPVKRKVGRPRKSESIKLNASEINSFRGEERKSCSSSSKALDDDWEPGKTENELKACTPGRKRGRPPSLVSNENDLKCGKCQMSMRKRAWENHNALKHAGLGWLENEPPIDQRTMDPQELLIKIRAAFKLCKMAICEICGVEKRSFLGLHSHVLVCGKTLKEQEQSMAKCEICDKHLKLYSLSSHMRMHTKESPEAEEVALLPKRRSAIKAITNLQQVLDVEKKGWIKFNKADTFPDLNFQLKITGKNQIPCPRKCCSEVSSTMKIALYHLLHCPTIPHQYYQCLECPHFDLNKEQIIYHCDNSHGEKNNAKEVAVECNEYDASTESEGDEEDEVKRIRSRDGEAVKVAKAEFALKTQFAAREKLYTRDFQLLYPKALEEEMLRQSARTKFYQYDNWYTSNDDWIEIEEADCKQYLPPLHHSLPIRHRIGANVTEYQTLNQFQSLCSKEMNIGFVGGIVHNLSWCPVSLERVREARQYLALSVGNNIEHPPSLRLNSANSNLLQIWDCGTIDNSRNQLNSLSMVLGIAMNYGEVWDLTWSPHDAWQEGDFEKLTRIGLIATASHDGNVRIYSISLPKPGTKKPTLIYKVHPAVILKRENWNGGEVDACLRLSWGEEGVLCAGYRSGQVSVWRLQALSAHRVFKQDKTLVLQSVCSFNAHHHPITAIALCPSNNRILATGGSDKKMKVWDLMNNLLPLRIEVGPPIQSLSWMNNWPGLFFLLEENIISLDMPPQFNFCRAPILKTQSSINDMSFNNWAFLNGVVNTAGEFVIRRYADPFIDSKKKTKFEAVISKVLITPTNDGHTKHDYGSYADLEENKLGITFTDYSLRDSLKYAEKTVEEPYPAKFTGNAIKKIAFNPNYRVFHHVALGIQSGFIRVMRLKYLQEAIDEVVFTSDNEELTLSN